MADPHLELLLKLQSSVLTLTERVHELEDRVRGLEDRPAAAPSPAAAAPGIAPPPAGAVPPQARRGSPAVAPPQHPARVTRPEPKPVPEPAEAPTTLKAHKAAEKERILAALGRHRWNKVKAAEEVGLPRRTFYRRLKDYGIEA